MCITSASAETSQTGNNELFLGGEYSIRCEITLKRKGGVEEEKSDKSVAEKVVYVSTGNITKERVGYREETSLQK